MMKNWAQFPVAVVLGLILFLCSIYAGHRIFSPALPLVGVIQWTSETKSFEDCLQGVIDGLGEEGFQEGINIRLEVKNIQEERDQAAAAAQDFRGKSASLLITVGTVPTLIALEVTRGSKIPIVYTNVGAPDATGLARRAPPASLCFTGTCMRVPALEQLRFLLMARPGIKRLGILFCTATPPAEATGCEAEMATPELGLTPIKRTVPDDRPEYLSEAVTDLLSQSIEALFIPSDPVLIRPKNLKIICDLTTRAMVPVMVPDGSSLAYGPFLAYHCDFVEIGRQSGRQAARLLQGVPLEQVPPESPDIKKLTINLKAAHDLQLSLSRQLLSQAHQFYQ